jgi:diguanylate cyclase (GGDEF)-like protein
MFNPSGVLVYCNEQYRAVFPLTQQLRRRGMHIRDILTGVAETGEQNGIPRGHEEEWVDQIATTLSEVGDQDIELFDGRWLQVKTRPTADGSALVVTSDVTKHKQTEKALLGMTEQLKLLATTDGLTGLTNRRAFDQALDAEISRARRSGDPLSLLMVDVDRFKRYNDIYGHQAGDEVLKTVAVCLKSPLRRPGDVAARYGGEEFVAILPNTDEDGAFFIADEFRESIRALHVPHKGGDQGELTVSVGLATVVGVEAGVGGAELVRRADEALYGAKTAGRDRVTGWRANHAARKAG